MAYDDKDKERPKAAPKTAEEDQPIVGRPETFPPEAFKDDPNKMPPFPGEAAAPLKK